MKQARVRYLRRLAVLYRKSIICMQKFARGYLVFKTVSKERRELTINTMTAEIEEIKRKHAEDLCIRLSGVWRRYLRRKERAAEKKRREAAQKAANKKNQGRKGKAGARPAPGRTQSMTMGTPATAKKLAQPAPTQTPAPQSILPKELAALAAAQKAASEADASAGRAR